MRAAWNSGLARELVNDSPFWRDFVDRFWEAKSALIAGEQTRSLPRIEPDELFHAMVACTNDYGRGGRQITRLYVDESEVDVLGGKYQALLPQYDDGSFEGYNHRMVAGNGFHHYALIVTDWHQFDRSIWDRIVEALAGLTEEVGISASRMDTQLFLGTYKTTPFGVHEDATSAFHFPVIGRKVMRFWPHSFAANNPALHHAHDYGDFLDESIVVEANPGEVIYWPSNYWHVGEGDGTFSVTWRFAYWIADGIRRFAAVKAAELFQAMESGPLSALPKIARLESARLDPINDIIGGLQRAVSSDQFRQTIVQAWLERYSAYGFLRVPARIETPAPRLCDAVHLKRPHRILASRVAPSLICVAAAGRSCIFEFNNSIQTVIDVLNQGNVVKLEELLAGKEERTAILQLVEFGLQSGALLIKDNA